MSSWRRLVGRAERRVADRTPRPTARRHADREPSTPVGRWLGRHPVPRRVVRGLAVASLTGTALLAVPTPAYAFGCTTAPTPESPGQGITGFFMSKPEPAPANEDPFVTGSRSSPFEQYGLAGLSWYTYDLGCGGAARDPTGAVSTWAARTLFIPAKTGVAALAGVSGAALDPSYLGAFDPLLTNLTDSLHRAVFTPLAPLAVMLTGLLLMAQATRQRVSSSTTAIGWCLLVTVLAAALFAWPVRAGHAADRVIQTGVGAVSSGISGQQGEPGNQVANLLYKPFLYRMWLMGEFCDPDSAGAQRYGKDLLQAQTLSWQQSADARDMRKGQQITEEKQKTFDNVARDVKNSDPAAYQCVAGHGSASLEAAILADVGVLLMAPFLLVGGLILIAAYLIIRFAVILAPALLTAGAFFPLRGLVVAAARVVAAAMINGILFTLSVLLTIRVDAAILDPSTRIPAWLRLVLVGVVTVVMWYLTRPFRKLTTMVSTGRLAAAAGDSSWYERAGMLGGRRRDQPSVITVSDDDRTIVVNAPQLREEARSPAGYAAAAVGGRGRGRWRQLVPASVGGARPDGASGPVHMYSSAGNGTSAVGAAAAAGGGASVLPALAARRRGANAPGGGAAGIDRTRGDGRRELPAGSAAGTSSSTPAAWSEAAPATGARTVGARATGTASVPVHTPPVPADAGRRAADRAGRATTRRMDDGLFDAAARYRPAPEDDNQGYLKRVDVELIDGEELYRLFDPDPDRDRGGARDPAWSG